MTASLRILALLAATGGALGLTLEGGVIARFLEPLFEGANPLEASPLLHVPELVLAGAALLAAGAGIALAFRFYLAPDADARRESLKAYFAPLLTLVRNKFYIDETYGTVFVWPAKTLATVTAYGFDVKVIDGAVNGVGKLIAAGASRLRQVQTGLVRRYVMAMFGGAVAIVAILLARLG
jgi:NADH-quinone oxidoreductase subunit L